MNMKKMQKLLTTAILMIIFYSPLQAGEIIEVMTKDLNGSETKEGVMQFLFSNGFIKMKSDQNTEMIFNNSAKNMTIISHDQKSYMVMDQNSVSSMKNQINQAMEQALANVPAEQRGMVEKMMKQRIPQMAPPQVTQEAPKTDIRLTTRNDTINGYDCVFYEAYRNEQKQGEYCVSEWSELDASDNIETSFKNMSEFMEGMLEQFSDMAPIRMDNNPFSYMKDIGGFPVFSRQYTNGKIIQETTLSSITESSIDDAVFQAPEGYQTESFAR